MEEKHLFSQNSSRTDLELPNWFFRQKWQWIDTSNPIWVNIINYFWVISEVCTANSWKTKILKKVWHGLTLRLGVRVKWQHGLMHLHTEFLAGGADLEGWGAFWRWGLFTGRVSLGFSQLDHPISCPLSASWHRFTVTNRLMLLLSWLPAMPAMTVCNPF